MQKNNEKQSNKTLAEGEKKQSIKTLAEGKKNSLRGQYY